MTKSPYLAGEWYVVITCRGCNERHPVIHDLTKGQATISVCYIWQCPSCGKRDTYEGEEVQRYRHPNRAFTDHAKAAT
jgi:hypothetical protein